MTTTTTADSTYNGIRQDSTQHKSQLLGKPSPNLEILFPWDCTVLSTNFDDEDTRQALGTLSDLYTTLKSKDALVVVEDIDDEVFCDSVDASTTVLAESVPGKSAVKAQKYLRRDMENKLMEGSKKFLEALGEVNSVSHSS